MTVATEINLGLEFRNKRFTSAALGLEAFANSLGASVVKLPPTLKKELQDFLDTTAKALSIQHGKAWPGGTTPKTLSARSGAGMASVRASVQVTGNTLDDIRGIIGGSRILRIHEFGGTVRAKRVKYLTIPLKAALNSNGTPKKKSAREWDNTFVAKSKNGNLIIFQRVGASVVPLYLLRAEVKIPPRLGMGAMLKANTPLFVDKAISAMMKAVLAEVDAT